MAFRLDDLDARTRSSIAAYDGNARRYQEALRLRRPAADVRRFTAFAEHDALVLDAGCGPASDLRLLRDAGVHPVGVDLSMGALREARMLLPRHPLVRASFTDLPFGDGVFGGLWLSSAFTHLARDQWRAAFVGLLRHLGTGPVHFSCYRGTVDLVPVTDELLGDVHVSAATEDEVAQMFAERGLEDVTVEVRPDPIHDRRRPWVVALGVRR
ncbi:MAG: class I SAM-dependent methyltransferase [Actinomycetes bacterium]